MVGGAATRFGGSGGGTNLRQRGRALTLVDERSDARERAHGEQSASKSQKFALVAEGEGFEPSVDRKAHNGFRDRPVQPLRHPSGIKIIGAGVRSGRARLTLTARLRAVSASAA